ncbi:MAG: biosynthetic arginine decarboxylase [Sandaracinaceae bacterium]|nr:biosynthetic arginine decarboxylase [Sandaracinaceae bacterium]
MPPWPRRDSITKWSSEAPTRPSSGGEAGGQAAVARGPPSPRAPTDRSSRRSRVADAGARRERRCPRGIPLRTAAAELTNRASTSLWPARPERCPAELELDEEEGWTIQRSADLTRSRDGVSPTSGSTRPVASRSPGPPRDPTPASICSRSPTTSRRAGSTCPCSSASRTCSRIASGASTNASSAPSASTSTTGSTGACSPSRSTSSGTSSTRWCGTAPRGSSGSRRAASPSCSSRSAASQEAGGLIICNGYKDRAYIETALLAQRFDKTVIVVLERIDELGFALDAAEKTGIRPALGVRAKLSAKGVGRWKSSAGDRAKFGLTAAEIVRVADTLAERDMLDCLQLLHFHIGSQISSIIPVKNALREAANIYVELAKMGAKMGYLDVGGGLAVDYDGSKTDYHASRNYDEQEYAYDVVSEVKGGLHEGEHRRADPGQRERTRDQRAPVGAGLRGGRHERGALRRAAGGSRPQAHRVLHELYETWKGILPKNLQESYHDAVQGKEEAESLFKFGYLTLRQRAQAERLFWHCCEKIMVNTGRLRRVPEEIKDLEDVMADIYYCNFSVFQSAPDVWAIGQLFPIMPIHRLNEEPTIRGHHRGPHLRQRREDRSLHRRGGRQARPRGAPGGERRSLLPRALPERRLPGDPRRPAQPVRRHQRRARARRRRRRLRGLERGEGRQRPRGARLRGVRHGVDGGARAPAGRARLTRGAHHDRPGEAPDAPLRRGAAELHVPDQRLIVGPRSRYWPRS